MIKEQKVEEKAMSATTSSNNSADVRPYVTFKINSKESSRLLESGASLNFLGQGCKDLIKELDGKIKPVNSVVKTADSNIETVANTLAILSIYVLL